MTIRVHYSRHYNSTGHNGIEDIRVYILEFINAHPDSAIAARTRDTTEKRWIYRLRSLTPMGLNLLDINLWTIQKSISISISRNDQVPRHFL